MSQDKRTIYKYVFDYESDIQEFKMPSAAIPLCVHMQGKNICMWCDVCPANPQVTRKFFIVGTGNTKPEGCRVYLGSVFPDPFVFHIYTYEEIPNEPRQE
jgi:hypothetical protein